MAALWRKELADVQELLAKNRTLPEAQRRSTDQIDRDNRFWASTVPKGFKLDPHPVAYTVSTAAGPIQVYVLPSLELGEDNRSGLIGSSQATFRGVAECRVQAPDGRWWLASRDKVVGGLSYILQDQTEPASSR
jgi:hypothetical protein